MRHTRPLDVPPKAGEAPSISAYIESLIIVRDGGLRGRLSYLGSTFGQLSESDPEVERANLDFARLLGKQSAV